MIRYVWPQNRAISLSLSSKALIQIVVVCKLICYAVCYLFWFICCIQSNQFGWHRTRGMRQGPLLDRVYIAKRHWRIDIHAQYIPLWRHQMETFSWLLALCEENPMVSDGCRHKDQWHGALVFSLICAWTNNWANNRDDRDLRRNRAQYDVTIMTLCCSTWTAFWDCRQCIVTRHERRIQYVYYDEVIVTDLWCSVMLCIINPRCTGFIFSEHINIFAFSIISQLLIENVNILFCS